MRLSKSHQVLSFLINTLAKAHVDIYYKSYPLSDRFHVSERPFGNTVGYSVYVAAIKAKGEGFYHQYLWCGLSA